MNIRQAARWAEREDMLYRVDSDGQPDYLYAVYDLGTHMVECIGNYDKCNAYRKALGCENESMKTVDGRWLRMEALDTIVQEMDASEGEARCIPDACEQREWE